MRRSHNPKNRKRRSNPFVVAHKTIDIQQPTASHDEDASLMIATANDSSSSFRRKEIFLAAQNAVLRDRTSYTNAYWPDRVNFNRRNLESLSSVALSDQSSAFLTNSRRRVVDTDDDERAAPLEAAMPRQEPDEKPSTDETHSLVRGFGLDLVAEELEEEMDPTKFKAKRRARLAARRRATAEHKGSTDTLSTMSSSTSSSESMPRRRSIVAFFMRRNKPKQPSKPLGQRIIHGFGLDAVVHSLGKEEH